MLERDSNIHTTKSQSSDYLDTQSSRIESQKSDAIHSV